MHGHFCSGEKRYFVLVSIALGEAYRLVQLGLSFVCFLVGLLRCTFFVRFDASIFWQLIFLAFIVCISESRFIMAFKKSRKKTIVWEEEELLHKRSRKKSLDTLSLESTNTCWSRGTLYYASPQHPDREGRSFSKCVRFPSFYFDPSSFLRLCHTIIHYANQNYAWCECTFRFLNHRNGFSNGKTPN